jgi:hypothetical protein
MSDDAPPAEEFSELVPQYVRVIDPAERIQIGLSDEGMVLVVLGTAPLHETFVVHPLVGAQMGPAITQASVEGLRRLQSGAPDPG